MINPAHLARMQAEALSESGRARDYDTYEAYYDGAHVPQVPNNKLRTLQEYTGFRSNLCDVVIDALAERLIVLGFTANKGGKALLDRTSAIWQHNRLDEGAGTIHAEAPMLGDSYLIVDWDAGIPRLSHNHPSLITLRYEDGGNLRLAWAAKRWESADLKTRRKNVYYPDRVERFFSAADGFGNYSEAAWRPFDGDDSPSVLPWTDKQGRPLGIPVIPFRNKAKGRAYGRSELANVLPLQDAINKTLVDLLLVLDAQGWPQRWVRGSAPAGGWQVAPGRVWSSNDPNFQAGELTQAEPEGLLNALKTLIDVASARSRTPQHLFNVKGAYPSGEALKTAEAPLVSKARDRQISFGNAWEDAMLLALRLDNTFGSANWDVDGLILQTQWKDPELRNDLSQAQAVSTKAPWLSHAQVLRELGYTQEQITTILREYRADKERENALGGQLLDAFGRGQLPGDPGTGTGDSEPEPGGQATTRNEDR